MAITSITHRITGVLLFVAIAYLLWLLDTALSSADGFAAASATLAAAGPRLVLLGVIAMLWFHILAGLKHLVMDFHHWDTLEAGRHECHQSDSERAFRLRHPARVRGGHGDLHRLCAGVLCREPGHVLRGTACLLRIDTDGAI
ncbi:MAG: succinate dehydrogenase, cytochrome b556 subunit [Pseudomonadales bacterium]